MESKGTFFGVFWAFYQGSSIIGSFIGGLIFKKNYTMTQFYIFMGAIAGFVIILFAFVRKPYVVGVRKESIQLGRQSAYYTQADVS